MADSITVNGTIATDPRHVVTNEGLEITSFRLASSQRYFDRKRGAFIEGETNWYTVSTFRQLAAHASVSLHKGDRVLVRGRMKIRDWSDGDKSGRVVEIEADSLGHDLLWGTAVYTKSAPKSVATIAPTAKAPEGQPDEAPEEAPAVLDEDAFLPTAAAAF